MRSHKIKTALAYLFIVTGQIAAALNGIAAVVSGRDGQWGQALLYMLIAFTLCIVTIVAWYSMTRQRPYRWRDGGEQ